jgi:hypothetical protein
MILDQEIELKPEGLDAYCEAAASVVAELQDFLGSHCDELIKCHMEIHGLGIAVDMPVAHQDPQYAAHIHKLKSACDAFVNAMRNNY